MKANFTLCLEETLRWEGGYTNHPLDPGGPTNLGIIQVEYDRYNTSLGLPLKSVKQITKEEAILIYKKNYWDSTNCDDFNSGIDLIMFDFAVNSGPSRAINTLHKIRPGSNSDTETINKFMDERERFLRSLSTFPTFGKGWMNRTKGIRAKALSMTISIPQSTVIQSSTKLSTLQSVRRGLTGVTVVGGSLMSIDTLTNAATLTNYLKTFLTANWIPLTLATVAITWIFLKWLEWMHLVDFNEGRYIPSSMVQATAKEVTDVSFSTT